MDNKTNDMAEFLYSAVANQLYTLSFFTIGNESAAEQMTIDAFSHVFRNHSGGLDIETFNKLSIELIYRQGKKTHKKINYQIFNHDIKNKQILNALQKLSYNERFIVLLFSYHRYPIKQISVAMHIPLFITKIILKDALNKIGLI